MPVNWTEAALTDLRHIETHIAHDSPQNGRRMVERIFSRTEQLADFPRLGAKVPEYNDESLREVLENPYRIVYRVRENRVDVVAVVHAARRIPRGF